MELIEIKGQVGRQESSGVSLWTHFSKISSILYIKKKIPGGAFLCNALLSICSHLGVARNGRVTRVAWPIISGSNALPLGNRFTWRLNNVCCALCVSGWIMSVVRCALEQVYCSGVSKFSLYSCSFFSSLYLIQYELWLGKLAVFLLRRILTMSGMNDEIYLTQANKRNFNLIFSSSSSFSS